MGLIYIFDMILSADEFDTISPGHRGLYQLSDLAKINCLIQKGNMFLNCLLTKFHWIQYPNKRMTMW